MARTNLESFRLKERCSIKSSKRIFAREYVDFGIPFWRSKDVIDKSLGVFDNFDLYISKERFGEIADKFGSPRKNDLLISSVGNRAGQPYVVQDEGDFYFKDGNILWVSEFENLDPEFLAYWLKSSNGQLTLSSIMIGSAQKALTIDALRNLEVSMPTYSAQLNAVKSLKLLDCKIALNRQINQTLEQMAQALFKSWFVDFDPVVDNALDAGFFEQDLEFSDELLRRAEARKAVRESVDFKPLPEDIRQLFPAAFEESFEPFIGLCGWVPKGWKASAIGDLCKCIKGISYKSSELSHSDTALVTLKSFQRGGGYRLDGLKPYVGSYKKEQEVVAGDLIIAYTDVTQAADIIGKPAIVISDPSYKRLVVSLDVSVIRPNLVNLKFYLYGVAKTLEFQSHTYAYSTGTTVLHLSKNAVPDFMVTLPSQPILQRYHDMVSPLFDAIEKNTCGMRTLTNLRDTLLPKLISGELRLSDSEVETAEDVLA